MIRTFGTFRCQSRGEIAKRLAALMALCKARGTWPLQAPIPSACCSHGASVQLANRLHDYSCWHQDFFL
jgi:hypothetical protein